jgi:multidrug efflux system membrane fusion protein
MEGSFVPESLRMSAAGGGEEQGMDEEKHSGGRPAGEEQISLSNTPAADHPEENEQARLREVDEAKRKRRHRIIWIVTAVVVCLLFLLYHFSGGKGSTTSGQGTGQGRGQQGPAAITAGQSKIGNINIYVNGLGTVTPTYTVTVYSQITGRVMAVHYREGQMVRKGDPLIDIDPRPYQAMLTQAEGTLERDEGVLAQARIDLERYKEALARNAIAKQQFDDQQQIVIQDVGAVKADQGTVAYDQVQLDYCHIVAPIGGQVGLRLVDPGNTIFSGSSSVLVVITQLQPITVVFNVSEDNLAQIKAQLSGRRTLDVDIFDRANEKQIESGKLMSLDNQVDTTTGTIKFRAEFSNKEHSLFPNQFVNARLRVSTLQNATLVPSAAVQHNGTAAFVYIVQPNNTVTVQPITTLTSDEQVTAVEGVNAGLNLATSGFDRLENGVQVIVRGPAGNEKNAQGRAGNSSTGGGSSP